MTQPQTLDPIERTFTVSVPAERAFVAFAEELASWWPSEYTWAQDVLETIGIEPREGGRCFERGPHGFTCDWGRVLEWNPPHRLIFTWQISPERIPEPNPAKVSTVEVRFTPEGPSSTRVHFEHRGLGRHGEQGAAYRTALDDDQGWTYILDRYAEAVAEQQDV